MEFHLVREHPRLSRHAPYDHEGCCRSGRRCSPYNACVLVRSRRRRFSIVSQTLTDRADLDPVIRSALYQALTQLDGQFPAKLAKLKAFIQDYTATSGNLDALLKEQAKDLAPVAQQVATAWYLGIVGSGKTSKTITYANTLANAAVADVLTPPSYGFGEVNSWAAKPV